MISQAVLSSKHLLTTTSVKMEFNKEFYTFFNIIANEIILNTEDENYNLNDYSLLIIKDNLISTETLDESGLNDCVTIFHVRNNKTGEIIEMREKEGNALYLSNDLVDSMSIGKKNIDIYEIPFIDLPEDKLFVMEIENNELTRPLYNIMGLTNSSYVQQCA